MAPIKRRPEFPREQSEKFLAGVIIKANSKGWMDEEEMSEWLRDVYVKRPDGFSHKSPFLLICDFMRTHLTDAVKNQVKQTNSDLAIISGGLTKELQPLDTGVNRLFKVKLRAAWEYWIDRKRTHIHQDGNPGQVPPLSADGSWMPGLRYQSQVSSELSQRPESSLISNSKETDSDNDKRDPGMIDAENC